MATNLNATAASPNVNVNITDDTTTTTVPIGTNIFVTGFSPQGPTDEPTYVENITDFENTYGIPTTPAERYFHDAVNQLTSTSNANVLVNRMPYGSGAGIGFADQYSALVYPIVGVSAVAVSPCDFYRTVDEATCQVSFPWLYTNYFTSSSLCYGSKNLNCAQTPYNEQPGYLYIQNYPFEYDSVMTGFNFNVNNNGIESDLEIFQLRPAPALSGYSTQFTVVTSFYLSQIYSNMDENQVNLANNGVTLLVNIQNTSFARTLTPSSGLLSGVTLSGIFVSAGDVFGTYSYAGDPVLSEFNTIGGVGHSYQTSITNVSAFAAGTNFYVTNTALQAASLDQLITFCGIPVDAGLSCQTITALGLTVPEQFAYNFYPLIGEATLADANFYVIGEPVAQTLDAGDYQLLVNGQFNWQCGAVANNVAILDVENNNVAAGLIVINEIKSAQLPDYSGYYVAVNDNLNINPSTDYNGITGVNAMYSNTCPGVTGSWVQLPQERLNFELSAAFDGTPGSISEIIENGVNTNFGTPTYNDCLIVTLFKLQPAQLTSTIDVLNQTQVEQYYGSLNANRYITLPHGGPPVSLYLAKEVNDESKYLQVLVNPYLSKNNCWMGSNGLPQKTVRMYNDATGNVFSNFNPTQALQNYADNLYGVGVNNGVCQNTVYNQCQLKNIGNLPAKLSRMLMEVENPEDYPLDITIDAGLSTIWSTQQAVQDDPCVTSTSICYNYDDTYYVDTSSLSPFNGTNLNSPLSEAWETIFNVFDSFGTDQRPAAGDVGVYHINDPIRQIFINGANYKVSNRQKLSLDPISGQPSNAYSTFSRNIWSYLNNLYSNVDSRFSEAHANWIYNYDAASDTYAWFPSSAYKAALYARNDNSFYPWTPSFGEGVEAGLQNVLDIAINPNLKERSLLSKINLNPICKFKNSGYVVYNSLTLQQQESALSENYITRGALWLGKALIASLRQFIGKLNTVTTRTQVVNTIQPILDYMVDNNGLYAYVLVCDSRNNNGATIDSYTLNVDVYVQYNRGIKFINGNIIVEPTGITLSNIIPN